MRKAAIIIGSLMLSSAASAISSNGLPRPERSELQALLGQVQQMQGRINDLLSLMNRSSLEDDQQARSYLLQFSTKLENLNDALRGADTNWNNNDAYGQSIKDSCLETRRLFVLNGLAERAAGEQVPGTIRPDNPVFGDSRIDVRDIRATVFCDSYEKKLQSQSWVAWSHWNSAYLVNGQRVDAPIEFQGDHGFYQTSGFRGELKDLIFFDDHMSGRWQVGADSGWIEFPQRGNSFQGHWGRGELGSPLGGSWWGSKG